MERRKVCRYFEKGSCKKDNCPFVHLKQNRKTCDFFLKGGCRKGDKCNFFHPPKQQIKKIVEQKKEKPTYQKQVYKQQYSSDEDKQLQKKEVVKKEQQNEPQDLQKNQVKEEMKQQNQIKIQLVKQEQISKIRRINHILGIKDDEYSDSDSEDNQQVSKENERQQLQFFKQYPFKFPDLSKAIQTKQFIKLNEQRYFKDGFMNIMNTIKDPAEKQHYQIIRKYQDSFRQSKQSPRIYTINIRPLLFEQEMRFHFPFQEDTIDIKVNCQKYPQEKAKLQFINKSIPQTYKKKFQQKIQVFHSNKSVFETLKYIQNNFEDMYYKIKFQLQNEHFSKKQIKNHLKKEQKKVQMTEEQIKIKRQKKQRRQQRRKQFQKQQNREALVTQFKDGEKIQISSTNYELTVESTLMINCQYMIIGKILFYVQCDCQNQIMHVLQASSKKQLRTGVKLKCRKCLNTVVVCLVREIVQFRSTLLARFGVDNGKLIDVGGIAFKLGCQCDNQIQQTRLVLPGAKIGVNCHQCFQSMNIMYSGIKFFNPFLKDFQIQDGKQLPLKGSCKHLKLSFRYFRFACCGRLFSCDDCHQMGSIRKHQKLNGLTMLCGFCSHQQNVAESCAKCRKQLVKGVDKTGHWQGGMGCRDQNQLSKKDNKKYAGLTKKKTEK